MHTAVRATQTTETINQDGLIKPQDRSSRSFRRWAASEPSWGTLFQGAGDK